MENDRFRASDRRVVNSSSNRGGVSSSRQFEEAPKQEPRREVVESDVPYSDRTPRRGNKATVPKKRRKQVVLWVLAGILFLALASAGVWFAASHAEKQNTGIDTGKYQAVFLSNGQHYFGKLSRMNDEYFKLTDVYYLEQKGGDTEKTNANTQNTTEVELRKLGEKEIHGPEDTMIISKQQILLYENLTDKGQVVKSIDQHKQQAR